VEAAERYADGLVIDEERGKAFSQACEASIEVHRAIDPASETVLKLRRQRNPAELFRAAVMAGFVVGTGVGDIQAHIRGASTNLVDGLMRSRLLREIFGNPFRPVAFDPTWLTPAVVELAQTIYDDRTFDHMPELADALEQAGCDNAEVLAHLRGPGPHVRGCWALDLILGKE